MGFLVIILGIAIIFLIIQCVQWSREREDYNLGLFCGWAMAALFVLETICICESVSEPRPTAMDVYQGKTTIEYTVRDGVKTDSVVVWK